MTPPARYAKYLFLVLAAAAPLLTLAPPLAWAQASPGYTFLKLIEDRYKKDGTGQRAIDALKQPGVTLVNSRDPDNGETALHYVTRDRDLKWLKFLLQMGARPDIGDNGGTTPLLLATQMRFADGVDELLKSGASVDKANSKGETPLIRAVQMGDLLSVRLLITAGANPDKRDNLAGMTARDYAKRDTRVAAITAELDKVKAASPKAGVQGPGL